MKPQVITYCKFSLPSNKIEAFPNVVIMNFFKRKYLCILPIDPVGSSLENVGDYDPDLFEGDMMLTTEQRMAARLMLTTHLEEPQQKANSRLVVWYLISLALKLVKILNCSEMILSLS